MFTPVDPAEEQDDGLVGAVRRAGEGVLDFLRRRPRANVTQANDIARRAHLGSIAPQLPDTPMAGTMELPAASFELADLERRAAPATWGQTTASLPGRAGAALKKGFADFNAMNQGMRADNLREAGLADVAEMYPESPAGRATLETLAGSRKAEEGAVEAEQWLNAARPVGKESFLQKAIGGAAESSLSNYLPMAAGIATGSIPTALLFQFLGMAPPVVGGTYRQAKKAGLPNDEALRAGVRDLAAEMVGEAAPVGVALRPGMSPLKRIFATAGTEGLEEGGVTSPLQSLNAKLSYNPNLTLEEAINDAVLSMASGAIAGGPMGAVGGARAQAQATPTSPTTAFRPTPETAETLARAAEPRDRIQPMIEPALERKAAQPAAPQADRANFLYEPATNLSDEEKQIEARFGEKLGSNVASAVREYEARNTQNGTLVINTDQARDLSEDYNRDIESRSLYAAAVHEPASALVKRVWKDALSRPPAQGKEANVIFTAGGTGAGKTTAIDNVPAIAQLRDSSDIIYDGNLNNFEKATQRIEEALASGRTADIVYVYRDPVEAMRNGALTRAERQGRTVRIDAHADSHIGSLKVVSQLMERYKDDPRVNIVVLDNSRGQGGAVKTTIDKLPVWEYDALAQELINVVQADYEAGRISERVYRGTLGQRADLTRGTESRLQQGDSGEPQPQRPGQAGQAQEVTAEQDRALGAGDRTAGLTDMLFKGREVSGKLLADRSGKRPILGIAKYIKANPESGVNFTHERVSGFPAFVNTVQDFEKEIQRTIADIKGRGFKEDALWYETAGRTIWKYADGDLKRADVMTRLTAKFAQTMWIRENTTSLIQALEQMRKGEPIKAGRYPNVMRKEIDALLAAKEVNIGIPGINRKLASFYWNLWDEVLLAAGKNEQRPHLATVDQHINSYAQHQKVSDVSPQEYAYSDMLMREATRRLNKEGYGQKLIGRTLRPKEVQAALWGLHKKHVNASGLGTNEKIVSETAWNYPEYMVRATDVVQAETVPSSKVSGVSALPGEARQRFHKEAVEVLRHGGVDDLANRLGLTRYSFESSGGYDGSINPNIVVGVLASKESKQSGSSDSYHRFTHDAARMYATAWQYVYRQDAVPFYRADISIDPAVLDAARARRQENIAKGKLLKKDQYDVPMMSLGFDIAFKNGLTDQLERDTFALLRQAFGDSIGYTKTGHDSITVINYRDGETGVPFLIEDAEFERKINEVTRGNADVDHVVRFGAETYYEEHDWKADPAGAALEDKIREAGRPDLLEWLRDRRAAADKITARYEQAAEDRAQGVGEASAFYGRNPIDEIGVGKNSADHPAIFYLVPGSMGSRRNVGRPDSTHRKMLNAAAHDIEAAGFPVAAAMKAVRGVVTYNGNYAHWHAAWLPDHRVIGFSEMRLNEMEGSDSRQKYLRGWWAHELTHAIDDAGNGSISSGSPRLDFFVAGEQFIAKGDVVTEVAEAHANGGRVGEFFEYPLAYASQFSPATMKEELLAQLSRLYTTNRELMRRELPVSFEMMEAWYAQTENDSLAATRAGLQAALRTPGARLGGQERQLHGVDQAVPRADRGVSGVGGAGAGVATGGRAAPRGQGAVAGTQPDLFQSAYSGEKYAINLNLDRYDTAGAIKGLIEATAKNIADQTSRGPTATHEQTLADADKLGISEDQVLAEARRGGKPMSLPEARAYALAVRQLIVTRAEATKHLAETAFKSGDSMDRAEAMASLYHLAALQAVGMNLSAEAGRLLNSYRILAGVTTGDRMSDAVFDEERQKTAEQVLEQMFGGTNNIDDILSKVALMSTQQLASPKMRKALLSRRPSAFLEIWKAGLLSGPQTHVVNMASNMLTALIRAPETALAGVIGKLHGGDKVYIRETAALMAGMTAGTMTGARDAWQIIRHGEDANNAGKSETTGKAVTGENFGLTGKAGKAVDIAGEAIRTPFRALAAEDALFKGINRTGTLYALAYRQAIKEGARNVSMRARELVANPTREMTKAALDDGLYFTFNNQLGTAGQKMLDILHSTKAGKLAQFGVVPFFRTPVNILKFGIHRSPLAPLTQKFQEDFKAGGARRDIALSRMMTGTAIMSAAFAMAAAGMLTGGGEPEKERKAADRIAGWKPYSIRIGNKFYEYRRLEPLGMLLGMAADISELSDYMSREESDNWMKMAGMAFAQNITNKTFLSQLTNLIKAISEPQQYGDNYLGAMAGSFVPGVVGQAARARDPWERDTDPDKNLKGLAYMWDDVKRDILARIPGQREKLPLRRDALGQPMPITDSPSMFNPIRTGELRTDDPVAMELAAARARVSPAKGTIQNVKLTPKEKEAYGQASGTVTRARLEALFASPAYQGLPQFLRDERISKEMQKARGDVRDAIVKGIPAERRAEAKVRQLRR